MKAATEYLAKHTALAAKAFENHVITASDHRSWVLQKPYKDGNGYDSTYWVEIVALRGGSLVVAGDIDLVMFSYYGDNKNPESLVHWMGSHDSVDGYVSQKARIGMGSARECLIEQDKKVWLENAVDHVEHSCEGNAPEWLQDAMAELEGGGDLEEMLRGSLADSHDAYEAGAFTWGEVPSTRLIYAHAAIAKLRQLFRLRDAQNEKDKNAQARR